MPRPTLTVVGGEAREPDAEMAALIAKAAERMAEAAKSDDNQFFAVVAIDGDVSVFYSGGLLEAAVLAEEVAGDMKREAVGL